MWVWIFMTKQPSYSAFNLASSSLCCTWGTETGVHFTEEGCKITAAVCHLQWQSSYRLALTEHSCQSSCVLCVIWKTKCFSFHFLISVSSLFSFHFNKISSRSLPGASAAGERGPAEDGVCRREGRSHRVPRARSDAVLERASDVLRGVSSTDYHRDGQAEVLWHGPRSDHVDGLNHLSDRNRREAQVSTLQEQENVC